MVVTELRQCKLFFSGFVSFSSKDEYRYHSLLHPVCMQHSNEPKGLYWVEERIWQAEELLKYGFIEEVDVVDIDNMIF
jgi:predicted membrane-bound spermidine synthase